MCSTRERKQQNIRVRRQKYQTLSDFVRRDGTRETQTECKTGEGSKLVISVNSDLLTPADGTEIICK